MNATVHSNLSVKRYGGQISDYYELHDFFDSSKEVESSNKHRCVFHHMAAIKQYIIPIFGSTITNSDGRIVNVKDCSEKDHVLSDFSNRFLPTLQDYIDCVEDDVTDQDYIDTFQNENKEFLSQNPAIRELMVAPLYNTGKLKSLLLTHNSWFIGFVLPKIFKGIKIELKDYNISPSRLFNRMEYKIWMSNGVNGYPPSAQKLNQNKKVREISLDNSEQIIDGNQR